MHPCCQEKLLLNDEHPKRGSSSDNTDFEEAGEDNNEDYHGLYEDQQLTRLLG
jgi:hypothetical protein